MSLSAPAVFQRVKKLEEAGVITGYHAAVDPAKVGRPIAAIFRLRAGAADQQDRLVSMLRSIDGVACRYRLLDGSFVVAINFQGLAEVEQFVSVLQAAGIAVAADVAATDSLQNLQVAGDGDPASG